MKLTPEEMRQQADPNYQNKQAAAAVMALLQAARRARRERVLLPELKQLHRLNQQACQQQQPQQWQNQHLKLRLQMLCQAMQLQPSTTPLRRPAKRCMTKLLLLVANAVMAWAFQKTNQSPRKASKLMVLTSLQTVLSKHNRRPSSFSAGPPSNQPRVSKPQSQQSKPANVPAAVGAQSSAGASQGPPVIFTDECTASVRGMDTKVPEEELRNLLAACGEIKGAPGHELSHWHVQGSHSAESAACFCSLRSVEAFDVLELLFSGKLACKDGMPAHCYSVSSVSGAFSISARS